MLKKKSLILTIAFPIPVATIGTAVITESSSMFGKTMDGITSLVGSDHVTHDEHFYSMIANTVISVAVGSTMARSRAAKGEAPIAKYWL